MKIGIITGASSGLGRELFFALADEPGLDELWLIARRSDRLEAVAKERPKIKSRVIPLDLTSRTDLTKLEELLKAEKPDIRFLVNNAGFGLLGNVAELPYEKQADMVTLNCTALTAVCAMSITYMKPGSSIINISSIASFVPTPRMSVYCATKSFVTAFTRSLRFELKRSGINALAVCSGPMNTEFLDLAGINGHSATFDMLPRCNPAVVARKAVAKAKAGRGVYTERAFYKLYRILAKLLPAGFMMNFSKT